MYRQKLAVQNMQRIRKATGMYNHWDDHEFINDFSIPETSRTLYNRGVRAFRNYMPVTFSNERGIYRSFRWGKNLEVFFLDERSFRSGKASANGTCDNPETDEPDLAPTAPQSTRNVFSALVPSLSQPVSQACKNKINNPQRTYLGKPQLGRFLNAVDNSTATWKVVMNELPIQQFYALPFDRWEGYAYERLQLLNGLQSQEHQPPRLPQHGCPRGARQRGAQANAARRRGALERARHRTGQHRLSGLLIGPVATRPLWQQIDDTTGNEGNGQLISNAFFKPDPPQGVGMDCAQGGENSYAEVTVTQRHAQGRLQGRGRQHPARLQRQHSLRSLHPHELSSKEIRYRVRARYGGASGAFAVSCTHEATDGTPLLSTKSM